jgi:hypothetical protein
VTAQARAHRGWFDRRGLVAGVAGETGRHVPIDQEAMASAGRGLRLIGYGPGEKKTCSRDNDACDKDDPEPKHPVASLRLSTDHPAATYARTA